MSISDAKGGARQEPRKLNITDLDRIERFRRAGYGGSVPDALSGDDWIAIALRKLHDLRFVWYNQGQTGQLAE